MNITDFSTIDLSALATNTIDLNMSTISGPHMTVAGGSGDVNLTHDLSVSGNTNIAGDIYVMGRSLSAWMAQMDERLSILQINPELQAEFAELQALATQYRQLEAQLQQKMQTWQMLKD